MKIVFLLLLLTQLVHTAELTTPIFIKTSGMVLENKEYTLAKNANCPMLVIDGVQNVTLSNLYLDGNKDEQTSEYYTKNEELRNNCITIRNSSNINLYNIVTCRARSGGIVIEKSCSNITINGLNSYNNFFDGFCIYESEGCTLLNAHIHTNIYAGISLDWRANKNVFFRVTLENNGHAGIFMRDANQNCFNEVTLRHSGIYIHQRDNEKETGCSFNYFFLFTRPVIYVGSESCRENKLLILLEGQ